MYKRIINQTFLPVFQNKMVLMKALAASTAILIILAKLPLFFENDQWVFGGTLLLSMIVNIAIAITTHRVLLLGPSGTSEWGSSVFTKREWQFFLKSLLLGLIMVPVVLIGIIPYVGIFIAVPLGLMLFCRLSLVFPALSIDQPIGFSQAWEYTKNYKLLTFFTIILFPAIFSIIVGLVYSLVIGFLIKLISPHLDILYPILNVFITVFVISALSATYKVIREEHPEYFETPSSSNTTTQAAPIQETLQEESPEQVQDQTEEEKPSLPKTEQKISLSNSIKQHIIPIDDYEITFEGLKEELIVQYANLGFTDVEQENAHAVMIRNPNNINAYVSLSLQDELYKIETYNVQEADLEVFLFNKENIK